MASRKAKYKKGKQPPERQKKHKTPEAAFQAKIIEKAHEFGWEVYHAGDSRRVTSKGFPDVVIACPERGIIVRGVEIRHRLGQKNSALLAELLYQGRCSHLYLASTGLGRDREDAIRSQERVALPPANPLLVFLGVRVNRISVLHRIYPRAVVLGVRHWPQLHLPLVVRYQLPLLDSSLPS